MASWRFSLNFASKQATTGKPIGYTKNIQDPLKTYRIQPREKGWMLKVMEILGKMFSGWNESRECLGPLQNSKPKLGDGWICSKRLEKFPSEMMKLVRFNEQENQIQIGWENFCY